MPLVVCLISIFVKLKQGGYESVQAGKSIDKYE